MHTEEHAILLHDIRAAMLNHSGLQREVQDSLQQLTQVLHNLVPSPDSPEKGVSAGRQSELKQQVSEIIKEDIDQCLPMLQLSSDKLSALLVTLIQQNESDGTRGDSSF